MTNRYKPRVLPLWFTETIATIGAMVLGVSLLILLLAL